MKANLSHKERDLDKLVRTIHSCKNIDQLDVAFNMLYNFEIMYGASLEKTRQLMVRKRVRLSKKPKA